MRNTLENNRLTGSELYIVTVKHVCRKKQNGNYKSLDGYRMEMEVEKATPQILDQLRVYARA